MRTFEGYRPIPPQEYVEKGLTNSGTKPDYIGVIMPDGQIIIQWQTSYSSITIYPSWDAFWNITGHPNYGTKIVFLDNKEE